MTAPLADAYLRHKVAALLSADTIRALEALPLISTVEQEDRTNIKNIIQNQSHELTSNLLLSFNEMKKKMILVEETVDVLYKECEKTHNKLSNAKQEASTLLLNINSLKTQKIDLDMKLKNVNDFLSRFILSNEDPCDGLSLDCDPNGDCLHAKCVCNVGYGMNYQNVSCTLCETPYYSLGGTMNCTLNDAEYCATTSTQNNLCESCIDGYYKNYYYECTINYPTDGVSNTYSLSKMVTWSITAIAICLYNLYV